MRITSRVQHSSRAAVALLMTASLLAVTQSPASALVVSNDNFANATAIGSLPFTTTQSTDLASTESGEPYGCGVEEATLWYRFTPSVDTPVSMDTVGSTFDTVLNVYTGSGLSNLNLFGCNDDAFEDYTSRFSWLAQAGVTYYVQIGDWNYRSTVGDTGHDLRVNFAQVPEVPGDRLSDATLIETLPYSASHSTSGAGVESGEPTSCNTGSTVWYRLRTRNETAVTLDTSGSGYDTVVGVYTGTQMSDLALVGCDDESGTGGTSVISWTAAGKVDYYIQVGGWQGDNGDLVLNLSEGERVSPRRNSAVRNDDFEKASGINRVPSTSNQSTVGATIQDGEPLPCYATATVWYRFKPRKDGVVTLDTFGSNFDTVVAVFTGDELGGLTPVGCNNNELFNGRITSRLSWTAQAGVEYHIQVGSRQSLGGDLKLNLSPGQVGP